MDQEKPDSNVFEIAEAQDYPVQAAKRSYAMLGVGLSCMLIGAAAVVAILMMAPGVFVKPPQNTVVQLPKQNLPAASLYTEPSVDPSTFPDLPLTEPNADGIGKLPTTPPEASGPAQAGAGRGAGGMQVPPMNPFTGPLISGPVPNEWQGSPPSGEIPSGPSNPPPAKPAEDATLVTARSSGGDAEGDAAAIVSALRSSGASVHTAPHYGTNGGVVGVQVVASIPAKSMDSALSKLKSSGVSETGKWSVSKSERAERIEGMLSARVRELKAKETALLEKYYEDATEVVVVREEIQKLNQAIGASKAGPSSSAVIIIGVGSL